MSTMAYKFRCEDYGEYNPYSLAYVRSLILEESNPMDCGFPHVSAMVRQILFCNHIAEAHELMLAISTFDAEWAKTHRKYEPMGLNWSKLGLVSEWFFESHEDLPRPTDLAEPFVHYPGFEKPWGFYNSFCSLAPLQKLDANINQDAFDIHQWRDTDDPNVIAHCCRRLATPPGPGLYPSLEKTKEALAAAQKLYAQPQLPYTEWRSFPKGEERHYDLIQRPLAVELAIRAGEIETAADLLELAVKIDGLEQTHCGSENYLQLPGIYDVLPLLAQKGREGHDYFITKEEARELVDFYKEIMESRIQNGQNFPLAKASWKELLNRLANGAWEVNSKSYQKQGLKSAKDILFPPATKEEIAVAEKEVGKLPNDFKQMVRVSNGFKGDWHFLSGGMAGIRGISVGMEIDEYSPTLENHGLRDEGVSGNVIVVQPGARCDDFIHCIVPPDLWAANNDEELKKGEYICFPSTHWDSDVSETYESVREFVVACVTEVEEMVAKGEKNEDNPGEGSEDGTEKGEGGEEDDDGDSVMTDLDE